MSDESTQIHLKKSERSLLRNLQQPGETYGETIIRIIQDETVAVHLPAGLYNLFNQLAIRMSEETRPVAVNSLFSRFVTRFGAFFGFRGESFWDWGAQESAKANMIMFCDIDDDYTVLSAAVTQAMNTLIERYDVYELAPVLDQALEAVASAFTRLYPEEDSRFESREEK